MYYHGYCTIFNSAKIMVFSIVWQYYNIFLYFCTVNCGVNSLLWWTFKGHSQIA